VAIVARARDRAPALDRLLAEPGSVSLEVTAMVAEGDQVTLEWTSRARTTAGEPYENFCIAIFTVRDGRIAAVREYMDTRYAHRVLAT
jgi:uncharacterized protein